MGFGRVLCFRVVVDRVESIFVMVIDEMYNEERLLNNFGGEDGGIGVRGVLLRECVGNVGNKIYGGRYLGYKWVEVILEFLVGRGDFE